MGISRSGVWGAGFGSGAHRFYAVSGLRIGGSVAERLDKEHKHAEI